MDRRPDLRCWDIMQCRPEQVEKCPAFKADKPCWEVMREIDSPCANICSDCIVYITKNGNSMLSDEEIAYIFSHKGLKLEGVSCCPKFQLAEEKL